MGLLTVSVDTSQLEAAQRKLLSAIEADSIETVADTHKRKIIGLTEQGADAFGEIFHAYSPGHAKKRAAEGYGTDKKDLRMGKGRLYDLTLDEDTLTYADDDVRLIALGQMAHPKWSYHHRFLDVSTETNDEAADDLAKVIQRAL